MNTVNANTIPMLPFCEEILKEKYLKNHETTADEIYQRVAKGVAQAEDEYKQEKIAEKFYENMKAGGIGAGRIMSSAGTGIQATLINCFVQPIGDTISGYDGEGNPGIYTALEKAAETMRMGGGVGYNFSKIRPYGAWIKSTQSMASGPCSYMNVFDASCMTVESLGARRGAQLALLNIDHPDIEEFIKAKHVKGRWNNFNVSVGVTEAFMKAVEGNMAWELKHVAKPHPSFILEKDQYQNNNGEWVYKKVPARDIWNAIMENTYDHAEPGIIYLDTVNRENPLYYTEKIETTNPCVTADTWVHTTNGPRQVQDLIGTPFTAMVNGIGFKTESQGFFSTGVKPVYELETKEGYKLKLTPDHKVMTVDKKGHTEWKAAGALVLEERVVLHNHHTTQKWEGPGHFGEGILVGQLVGNGHFYNVDGYISVWCEDEAYSSKNAKERLLTPANPFLMMDRISNELFKLPSQSDFIGFQSPENLSNSNFYSYTAKSPSIRDLALERGIDETKNLTDKIEKTSSLFQRGFLRGLFDANGTVTKAGKSGFVEVRLNQSNLNLLERVQRMLARLGVRSKIYKNQHNEGYKLLPSLLGGLRSCFCQPNHELVIAGKNVVNFQFAIGFDHAQKSAKLARACIDSSFYEEKVIARFISLTPVGFEEVYDVTVEKAHAFDANGLMVHNCGEQPLPAYGCCDLGPINLTYLVKNPFGIKGIPEFDFDKLIQICETQVHFLDNVLTVTHWPLEEQKKEAFNKRRIGVGFTGLGNTLAMLCLKYGSDEGRKMAADISETMRNACYQASVDLAIEKGSFPLFNAEKYLAGDFVKRLPEEIRDAIKLYGIRNSHLLSIAPTGTVSLAFCNNASNGIEPPFTWTYDRKKRQQDGSTTINEVSDYSYRLYKELGGDVNNLPSYMQTALELTALEHMQMMEVVQPFIDSAISKTVNIPADYPYEDFKDLYMKAWKAGLKGIATYRPNATLGSVLSVKEDPKVEEKKTEVVELDIKTILEKKVIEKRPKGALPATIEKVEYSNHLGRGRFYLSIGYLPLVENNVEVLRPIEFFLKNLDAESNDQWSESAMRMLSLAARGGFLDRALKDMQKVSWDRGPVRLGETEHVDGHKVPKYHNSESAAVAYAILTSIKNYQKQSKVVVEVEVEKTEEVATQHFSGKICTDCGAAAVIKRDGCSFCENCGLLGSCG